MLGLERRDQSYRLKSWDIVGTEVPFSAGPGSDGEGEKSGAEKKSQQAFQQLEEHVARQWPRGVPRPARLNGLADTLEIVDFALTDDGRNLATIDLDNTYIVHIWDLTLGREIARITNARDIDNLHFSGKYLIGESGATRHYWLWRQIDMKEEACLRLTRNFSMSEWASYVANERYKATCENLPVPSAVEEESSQAGLFHSNLANAAP